MHIDGENRRARLAVREFCEFSLFATGGAGHVGLWRMESGRRWHETVQAEKAATFTAEKPIRGTLEHEEWTLELEGRIDLFSETGENGCAIGEIKTLTDSLPLDAAVLRERYPSYFLQLAAYRRLLCSGETKISVERAFLLFIDIDTGLRQEVEAEENDTRDLEEQLARVIRFLETMRNRFRERRSFTWPSFREHPRPVQIEAQDSLRQALASGHDRPDAPSVAGFEAPTGFGKTRILLEYALEALQTGEVDRILYLTGKNSGQVQALRELDQLFPEGNGPSVYRIRNHAEHYRICPLADCQAGSCASELPEIKGDTAEAGLYRLPAAAEAAWTAIADTAEALRACPYDLSRAALPLSDIWIGDYNYLFAPGSRHIFREQPGFDPMRTFLLIDEAHNLPDRVVSALSLSLREGELENVAEDLRMLRAHPPLRHAIRETARAIRSLIAGKVADTTFLYRMLDLLETITLLLRDNALPWSEFSLETVRLLQDLQALAWLLEKDNLHPVLWSPTDGEMEGLPLEASSWIGENLEGFKKTVCFSATLSPFGAFAERLGLPPGGLAPVPVATGESESFRVAIDARVDTRLRQRETHYHTTAHTAMRLAENAASCIAVYFPSYRYAESVRLYLEVDAPHLRVEMQPGSGDSEERDTFATEAPLRNDLLFLVLGGSFAEAIDSFGGVVGTAMIVGPGLPELNTITRMKMDRFPDREHGFHSVCRIPGMRRVNQAIGRLVRDHHHRARILLHDRRFCEDSYHQLLRDDLGEIPVLRNERAFEDWLMV